MSNEAQLVVISVPASKNDFVVGLVTPPPVPPAHTSDLVGELVGVLVNRFSM